MKSKWILGAVICSLVAASSLCLQTGCTSAEGTPAPEEKKKELSQAELISRGKYLVTIGGCNDCHSPKNITDHGPVIDSVHLLSGHPAGMPLPPFDGSVLKPAYWIAFGGDGTTFAGPWGISYSANLTPDSTTGIGAWTEEVFIKTLRTGKHLGQEGGRPLLPPMPWEGIGKMEDEDLKALFTYLKALPPIHNPVPAPATPDEAAKLAKK
ncbi:MAG: diheme cytochrome c-553 [Chitinophagaceae bacterium]